MKSHLRPLSRQRTHAGLVSSHLICRTLVCVSLINFPMMHGCSDELAGLTARFNFWRPSSFLFDKGRSTGCILTSWGGSFPTSHSPQ
jgi:hypothetical protein